MREKFLAPNSNVPMRTPPVSVTGPGVEGATKAIPMEDLTRSMQSGKPGGAQEQSPSLQFVPMMVPPTQQQAPAQSSPGTESAMPQQANRSKD